mmetsp:Transcript_12968/g.32737  ORF Transcript_12968/g.32737 Transcript_12968/m.32737 type:complete len:202 (+) Transcript_12968:920-1525(+)
MVLTNSSVPASAGCPFTFSYCMRALANRMYTLLAFSSTQSFRIIREPLVSRSCRSLANRLRMALRTSSNCSSSDSSTSPFSFRCAREIRDKTCKFKRTTASLGSESVRISTGNNSSIYSFMSAFRFSISMLIQPKAAILVGTSSLFSNSLVSVSRRDLSSKGLLVPFTRFSKSSSVRSATIRISTSPSEIQHKMAPRISEW